MCLFGWMLYWPLPVLHGIPRHPLFLQALGLDVHRPDEIALTSKYECEAPYLMPDNLSNALSNDGKVMDNGAKTSSQVRNV